MNSAIFAPLTCYSFHRMCLANFPTVLGSIFPILGQNFQNTADCRERKETVKPYAVAQSTRIIEQKWQGWLQDALLNILVLTIALMYINLCFPHNLKPHCSVSHTCSHGLPIFCIFSYLLISTGVCMYVFIYLFIYLIYYYCRSDCLRYGIIGRDIATFITNFSIVLKGRLNNAPI